MKRSGFGPRKSVLRRGALQRGAETSRKAALKSKAAAKKASAWPPGMRGAILELAGGCCGMCGRALPGYWECHHRRLRSQGGRDEIANALALHFACHDFAHDNRTWAWVRGYIVHRPDEPATRPVLRHGRVWQLLSDSGWVDCDPPADAPTQRNAA
jgi:hypothetical protein